MKKLLLISLGVPIPGAVLIVLGAIGIFLIGRIVWRATNHRKATQ